MKPTFEKTVDILVKAYLNDTLVATDCKRCAVGNIISQGNPKYDFYRHGESWFRALGLNGAFRHYTWFNHPDIINTGYTAEDLIRIESAFLDRDGLLPYDADDFDRLMNVVEVLAEIHGVSLEQKNEAKLQFVKP
jgi:hypothetical protein